MSTFKDSIEKGAGFGLGLLLLWIVLALIGAAVGAAFARK